MSICPPSDRVALDKASQQLQQNNVQLDKQTGKDPQTPAPINSKADATEPKLNKDVLPSQTAQQEPNAVDRALERNAQTQAKEPAQQLKKNDVSLQPDNER